jgi:hypothetical protein
MIAWLNTNSSEFIDQLCIYSVVTNQVDTLEWLLAIGWQVEDFHAPTLPEVAAERGHLDTLRWLYAKGCPFSDAVLDGAARYGHLDMVKWLDAYQRQVDPHTYRCAYEHKDVAAWIGDKIRSRRIW